MALAPRRSRALLLTAALIAPAALAACSGDDEPAPKDPAASRASHSSVEFRRVISTTSSVKSCGSAPDQPSDDACAALADFACPAPAKGLDDDQLIACGTGAYRKVGFLLGETEISKGVESAEAGMPEDHGWVIDIVLSPDATEDFATLTEDLAGTGRQLALVVDGEVVSAPAPATSIKDGRIRLELGDAGQRTASRLAQQLAS